MSPLKLRWMFYWTMSPGRPAWSFARMEAISITVFTPVKRPCDSLVLRVPPFFSGMSFDNRSRPIIEKVSGTISRFDAKKRGVLSAWSTTELFLNCRISVCRVFGWVWRNSGTPVPNSNAFRWLKRSRVVLRAPHSRNSCWNSSRPCLPGAR